MQEKKNENTLLIGDFNVEPDETNMKAFYNQHNLKSLNKKSTLKMLINHLVLTFSLLTIRNVFKII